jgi:hypothetical protein
MEYILIGVGIIIAYHVIGFMVGFIKGFILGLIFFK